MEETSRVRDLLVFGFGVAMEGIFVFSEVAGQTLQNHVVSGYAFN